MSKHSQKSILYVDDEEVNLFLFEKIFENSFRVLTSSSGLEGLEKLKQENGHIEVVISDMRMPEMNGLQFITKARESFKSTLYCILTGYEFNTDLEKALDTKIIDKIFKKPFDFELIKQAVDEYVVLQNSETPN